ncbi:uncharacterized protein [Typha angustifolia]|uniref:uncharacterized protein isoform X3 n=1 Tax=Typha angustifolia TaxID=59011 RepID=UPI003C2B65C1
MLHRLDSMLRHIFSSSDQSPHEHRSTTRSVAQQHQDSNSRCIRRSLSTRKKRNHYHHQISTQSYKIIKNHSHFEKVIQLLQVQAEEDPPRDAFENQETASQDNTCENEEMMDNNNKKEEASGWADQAHCSINSNIGIRGDQSPAEANDFEEWQVI